MPDSSQDYALARARYARLGVDTDKAMSRLAALKLSLQCWQGDDVSGFEAPGAGLQGGGILATGNYPGRARNAGELRQDLELALEILPGSHRVNLHALYGEFGGKVDRDQVEAAHFQGWIRWARERGLGLDFNPSFFSHPKAQDGYTLAHPDPAIRRFWIEHGKRSRRIAAEMGRQLGSPCVCNVWIPDGSKDHPADRLGPRTRLRESLDQVFEEKFSGTELVDTVECKLFGIGSEAYVAGSHEFYMAYALKKGIGLCLDSGHFHPTETVSDKLSSVAPFVPCILLHVSRGIRWDSDHVVVLDDELQAIARELVRGGFLEKTHLGLDYFDATLNRVAAWALGARSLLKALLIALLEPAEALREAESSGRLHQRLALLEEAKALPWGAVWEEHCRRLKAPGDFEWMAAIDRHEENCLSKR